ncbi:hypothetical protein E8E14_011301 [Neopestalotiopsis sp. 37M]|nr:hypothetical protein E8E14_011301 [Neopestalotiopsis sp. 37M]
MAGLPDVPGPKLLPYDFNENKDDFEFVAFLGKGIHAHYPHQVKLPDALNNAHSRQFPFSECSSPNIGVRGLELSEREGVGYFDPFSSECRAYGRLKEDKLEDYAVKCHGFILLGEKLQKQLKEKDHHDWEKEFHDLEIDFGWERNLPGTPLRSLVKDLVDANFKAIDAALSSMEYNDYCEKRFGLNMDRKTGTRLVRGMKLLHRSGILVRDVHDENIAHGKFLDFSSAWTSPHPCFTPDILHANRRYHLNWKCLSFHDGRQIDRLIDEWNEYNGHKAGRIWVRVTQDFDYLDDRLRPRPRFGIQRRNGVQHPAEMHNWSTEDKRRWRNLCKQP